jgi:hypothetical protein
VEDIPDKGGFSRLARADDVDHPTGLEGASHLCGQMPGNQLHYQLIRKICYWKYQKLAVSVTEIRLSEMRNIR